MEKRKEISTGIIFKKYFLSWFTILGLFIITKLANANSGFLIYAIWTLAILFSILCICLKKVEFTSELVYFNGKAFNYNQIKYLKVFDFNKDTFYLFITDSDNIFNKYHFTQLGFGQKIGYLGLFKMIFSKTLDKKLPLAQFLELLKEKSDIKSKIN
ncbi:hypothetical protein [uncultured Aquimarina sp.]|uniref:hypothetical protein n=1 Tax=uncultured Aquimarina sp. TaxID=575652 RepID=UPI002614846D|nr:hypothetical protein [uncultured Aquimarina sp.]